MPEPGFAGALYYQVTGDRASWHPGGRVGSRTGNGPPPTGARLRLVPGAAERNPVGSAGRQDPAAGQPDAGAKDPRSVRARAFAAIALADHGPDLSAGVLGEIVEQWWRKGLAPALKAGQRPLDRTDLFALMELFHAIRDNLNIDLREDAPGWYLELPNTLLLSYYPAPFPAAENEYRVPMYEGAGDPDPASMTFARVGELELVGYDSNLRSAQYLQGWLMHDQFVLRGRPRCAVRVSLGESISPGPELFPHAAVRPRSRRRRVVPAVVLGRRCQMARIPGRQGAGLPGRQAVHAESGLPADGDRHRRRLGGGGQKSDGAGPQPASAAECLCRRPAAGSPLPGRGGRRGADESQADNGGILAILSTRRDARTIRIAERPGAVQ